MSQVKIYFLADIRLSMLQDGRKRFDDRKALKHEVSRITLG